MSSRVLAIESDLRQASILKRIVREKVHADLVVVDSRDAAIAAINASIPDVILVTTLLSPRDEEELIAHLRTLEGAEHLQLHTIPQLASGRDDADGSGAGLFGKLKKKKDQPIPGCDPDLFADEIRTFLDAAEQAKAAAASNAHRRKLFDAPRPATSARSGDTHGSREFADFRATGGDAGEQPDTGLPLDEGVIGGSTSASAWASPFEWRPSGSSARPAAPPRAEPPSLVTNVPLAVVADEALEQAQREQEERRRREAAEREEQEQERKRSEAAARAEEEERQRKAAAARAEEERKRKEAAARAEEGERKRKEAAARAAEEERKRKEAAARAAEEERKRKEAAARAAEEERKRKEAEARAAEAERKRKEAEARAAAEERKRKEAAARAAEEERKRKEAEARAAEAERKRKEAEARAAEEERKRREAEARAAEEERKRLEAIARAEEERKRREAIARAEEEARKRQEAAARAEEEARQRREAERVRLEIEAAAARQRAEEERQRKEAAALEAERLRLEAEAAAARKRAEATVRKVAKKAKPSAGGNGSALVAAPRIVPNEFAEFSEEHEKLQAGILGLDRLDAWARRERRNAAAEPGPVEKDELAELFATLAIPPHVASIGYTGGCRIRRVRVPPDPSAKAAAGKKGQPVILSRRALDEVRSPGR